VPGVKPTTLCGGRKVINLTERGSVAIESNPRGLTYINNMDCQWILKAPANHHIRLNFTSFQTADYFDSVSVYQGFTKQLITLSGRYASPPFVYADTSAFIVFKTGAFEVDSGFQAVAYAVRGPKLVCGGRKSFNATLGGVAFASNALGSSYTDFLSCRWVIRAPTNHFVRLNFTSFATQAFSDYVRVYNGPPDNPQLLADLSGSLVPPPVVIAGREALVHFTSDSRTVLTGFQAVAYAVPGVKPTTLCGGRKVINLTERGSVAIESNPRGLTYINNMDCQWILKAPANHHIRLNFTSFQTADYFDSVSVYQGFTKQLITLSGRYASPPFVYADTSAFVVFKTGAFEGDSGFQAVAYAVRGPKPVCGGLKSISATLGGVAFASNPLGSSYTNFLDCQWVITAPANHYLRVNFTSIATEAFARVYDGLNSTYPLLATLDGYLSSPPVIIADTAVFVKFISNYVSSPSNVSSGFQAVAYAVPGVKPATVCGGRKVINVTAGGSVAIASNLLGLNYNNDMNCQWVLKAPTNHHLRLAFTSFETDYDDVVRVYEGFRLLLEKLNGRIETPLVIAVNGFAFVEFTTDSSDTLRGFQAVVYAVRGPKPVCGGRTSIAATLGGVAFASNALGLRYSNNLDCRWVIRAPANHYLRLNFTSIDLAYFLDSVK